MNKNRIKKAIAVSGLTIFIAMGTTGCVKPYDKPEFVTIEASQTAFLIPLVGDTSDQASFESEELLATAKVATKEIQIPHRWVQTGRRSTSGEYRDSATLIIVERKPVTREWTSSATDGTSSVNQAIKAESKESIGFSVPMTCSAQIDEENATKFLYRYNNKTLESIMDTDIRNMVASEFNKQCSQYTMDDILANKATISTNVVNAVTTFFAERGITITVLGMNGEFTYNEATIQESINKKFISEQNLVTQENENKAIISKAQAQAEANDKLMQSLTPELIEKQKIEKWNGVLPTVQGNSTPIINMTGAAKKE